MNITYEEKTLPSGAVVKVPVQEITVVEQIKPITLDELNEKLNLLMQMQLESEGIL